MSTKEAAKASTDFTPAQLVGRANFALSGGINLSIEAKRKLIKGLREAGNNELADKVSKI